MPRWTCVGCGHLHYAKMRRCVKCKTDRPLDGYADLLRRRRMESEAVAIRISTGRSTAAAQRPSSSSSAHRRQRVRPISKRKAAPPGPPVVIDLLNSDGDDDETAKEKNLNTTATSSSAAMAAAAGGGSDGESQQKKQRLEFDGEGAVVAVAPKEEKKDGEDDDGGDDDVVVVEKPAAAVVSAVAVAPSAALTPVAAAATSAAGKTNGEAKEDDEDVALVGTIGTNALVDFPHAREDCVGYPLPPPEQASRLLTMSGFTPLEHKDTERHERHCPNCYCYVCDVPASRCEEWTAAKAQAKKKQNSVRGSEDGVPHCIARSSEGHWRRVRAQMKKRREKVEAARLRKESETVALIARAEALRLRKETEARRDLAILRKRDEEVRNLAASKKAGERTDCSDAVAPCPSGSVPRGRAVCGGGQESEQFSPAALLAEVTRTHPVETSPPPETFGTTLRHYQRQSLAFMLDVENASSSSPVGRDEDGNVVRGGWLSSEVGMGKSAIVLALVAADAAERGWAGTASSNAKDAFPPRPTVAQMKGPGRRGRGSVKLRTTVVFTSVSLMGQWEDECKRHAPGLVVKRFHPQSRSRVPLNLREIADNGVLAQLASCDVLVSTATFAWPDEVVDTFEFRRVVMDEAHLFHTNGGTQAKVAHASRLRARRKWCVTATPCTGSIRDLKVQARFLGLHESGGGPGGAGAGAPLLGAIMDPNVGRRRDVFLRLVAELKKVMTRHTKSQCIGGTDALSLPKSTTTVVQLDMSPAEAGFFKSHQDPPKRHYTNFLRQGGAGIGSLPLERYVVHPLSWDKMLSEGSMISAESTKIRALEKELRAQYKEEERLRAVVFTQYSGTFRAIVNTLKKRNAHWAVAVYSFDGSTSATDRDFAIRCFQSSGNFPAVIVMTLRAGAAGITLTEGSHVYLMEPSLDPAAEIQAAGRIHRLGQTKPVEVKKFAFANSLEGNIVRIHDEVEAGRITINNGTLPTSALRILGQGVF